MGTRLGATERKAWVPLAGRPLLWHALATFRKHPEVQEIILVVAPDDMERARRLLGTGPAGITEKVVIGGAERRDSVWQGLLHLTAGTDMVLIHDAARPLVSQREISACIATVRRYGAAVVARPVTDTLKRAGDDLQVRATVERSQLWAAQTPQGFRTELLLLAYQQAIAENWSVTDDTSVVERLGHRVQLVHGEALNIKITHPEDLAFAERVLSGTPRPGFGYDVHRLVSGRALILGGVDIPHTLGLLGHSDADVLTHAVIDALLGAAALGDIGQQFPDTDPRYCGISSLMLLAEVARQLMQAGYTIINIDVTLAAQAPKIMAFIPEMRARLAASLDIDAAQVSVKATTTEGLGFVGQCEGIAAYATAVVLPHPGYVE